MHGALRLLHRWTGGLVGLALAVLGLSGTILLWEESWIGLPGADAPLRADPATTGAAVEAALALRPGLGRLTFADAPMALHQAIYADGGGAYLDQAGTVVDRWSSLWERPELWLFDLHHHLLAGETGETVTGLLGLALLFFCLSGLILWWRTRRTFAFRLWPARLTRSAIVRQHRDLGVIAAPLLVLTALTGTLMVFPSLSDAVLAPWKGPDAPPAPRSGAGPAGPGTDWRAVMAAARARFPDAVPRRLTLPAAPGAPAVLRLRQPFEWTPNGRTYVHVDPANGRILAVEDPARGDAESALVEKFYPVHSAKVGGPLWRLLLTFSGLSLVLLGTLATWSFWFRKAAKPARGRLRQPEGAKTA